MNYFEKLLGIIGDNAEAKEIVEKIKESQDELAKAYNQMEIKFNEAKEGRDKVKEQLRLVKNKFGLEELNEEALEKALKMKGDERFTAEIENLKKTLEEEVNKRKEVENSYKSKLQEVMLDNAFANSGLVELAANKETLKILKMLAKEGATFDENNNIVFKNPDGSTAIVDGRPMTIEDKIKQISSNEAYAGLFKPTVNSGANTSPDGVGGVKGGSIPEGLSATEMMKMGRRQN